MLDRAYIRAHPEEVERGIRVKGFEVDLKKFLSLDTNVRGKKTELESIRAKKRAASNEIAKAKGKERTASIAALKGDDEREDALRGELQALENELASIEREFPNLPSPESPVGEKDADKNTLVRSVGNAAAPVAKPKDYLALAEALELIDMERAAKVSGSRFGTIKGPLAELEFALVQYALATVVPKGFTPIVPPVLVREEAMEAMGYLAAHGDEETYHLVRDKLFLVGTSEQSVGPMHMDEVFRADALPLRYLAFSTCFRRESGTYGKDTKGILRVHQFDKLEMFSFTTPEQSAKEHAFLLERQEELMTGLKLPYRVLDMATGELGVPAARKFDIETWLPGQGEYRETHSTSNCTDFQARRLNIKYRPAKGKPAFVHTLNGTAFAIGRTLIAIIENYQQQDGSILIPDALKPYMRTERITGG